MEELTQHYHDSPDHPRKCNCPRYGHTSIEDFFKCSNGFKCTYCSKCYDSKEELTKHHYDSPDHPKKCKWCSNICSSNEKLVMHYIKGHMHDR